MLDTVFINMGYPGYWSQSCQIQYGRGDLKLSF